jgi:hypothetical protein
MRHQAVALHHRRQQRQQHVVEVLPLVGLVKGEIVLNKWFTGVDGTTSTT